jgi:hypothetical protein
MEGARVSPRKFLFAVLIGLLALAVVPARADTLTFQFTSDHCTGGCTTTAPNMGIITVSQTDAQALTGSVSVDVQLLPGFGFVSTGAGTLDHVNGSFFFRLLGDPTITITDLTPGWSIPNAIGTNQQAAGVYAGDGLSGQFEYALACDVLASGCGNGGSAPKAPPLDFVVTASGLTPDSFNDTLNASGSPFAADVISTTGNTGLIDASSCTNCGGTVPEPASVTLLGAVLLATSISLRKKFARN